MLDIRGTSSVHPGRHIIEGYLRTESRSDTLLCLTDRNRGKLCLESSFVQYPLTLLRTGIIVDYVPVPI